MLGHCSESEAPVMYDMIGALFLGKRFYLFFAYM